MKHIFLYVAPVYIIYLLRAYCFTISSEDGVHTPWYSFSITNLFKLGITVVSVFGLSFGPFLQHIPQVRRILKLLLSNYETELRFSQHLWGFESPISSIMWQTVWFSRSDSDTSFPVGCRFKRFPNTQKTVFIILRDTYMM